MLLFQFLQRYIVAGLTAGAQGVTGLRHGPPPRRLRCCYVPDQRPADSGDVRRLVRLPARPASRAVHVVPLVATASRGISAVRPPSDAATSRGGGRRSPCATRSPPTGSCVDGGRTAWLNAAGARGHDVSDAADFRLVQHPAPPAWIGDAVRLPDLPRPVRPLGRLADGPLPDWAVPCGWDDPGRSAAAPSTPPPVLRRRPRRHRRAPGPHPGLGANTLYLTPVFPARSNHRYDATTFDRVDPLLGGDAALARLAAPCTPAGMRVHRRPHHQPHRRRARVVPARPGRPDAPERGLLLLDRRRPGTSRWLGVPSRCPSSTGTPPGLRRAVRHGPGLGVSALAAQPYALDGWRIDVANMTGRLGGRRPHPRGGPAGRAAPSGGAPGRDAASPSTPTTPAPTSTAAAGRAR